MNYCVGEALATERCECYSFKDLFNEPKVSAICQVNQACVATVSAQRNYTYACMDICTAGMPGPCFNMPKNGTKMPITSGQVGLLLSQSDTKLTVFPIAESDKFLPTKSACLVKGGETPEWAVCEPGQYCGKLTETTAKCANLCPSASVVTEECLCRAQDGKNTIAQPGKFCADDGSVSEFSNAICGLNSFGNGTCKCVANQSACPATSVCVSTTTTVQCMPACELNADNTSDADCACRGPKSAQIVPAGGRCVIQSNGTAAPQTLQVCADKQIGPCACRVTTQSAPARYAYTDASSMCYEPYNTWSMTVVPLMPINSTVVSNALFSVQPCPNALQSPTGVTMCQEREYCAQDASGGVGCVEACYPGKTVNTPCLCEAPDGKTTVLARSGAFCDAKGVVSQQDGEVCYPSTMLINDCKCSASDERNCGFKHYCAVENGKPTCRPVCFVNDYADPEGCACPFSGSDALVTGDAVCTCNSLDNTAVCAAAVPCVNGQIGPCNAPRDSWNPVHVNGKSAYIDTEERSGAILLCKANTIANRECACEDVKNPPETPAKAKPITKGKACMRTPDGTTAIVLECLEGKVDSSACACRISGDAGGASYCAVGSTCMANPDDATKQVCWLLCSDANSCPGGKACIGSGANAHCEFECAAGCATCPEVPEFCTECTAGYYLTGVEGLQSCVKCPAACATCSSAAACDTCAVGYTGDDCDRCSEGYAKASGSEICEKIACDTNCDLCLAADNCKTCKNGFITIGAENKKSCMPNCLSAVTQCVVCATADTCKECKTEYTGEKCDTCADGYDQTGTNPLACAKIDCSSAVPNCATCKSTTECKVCKNGFTGDDCNTCATGYAAPLCNSCADGYEKTSAADAPLVCTKIVCNDTECEFCLAADNCKTCKEGFITTGTDGAKTCMPDCTKTITQCETCTDTLTCSKCNTGYQNPATNCVEMACADSVENCVSCTQPNGTACTKCKPGFNDDTNKGTCVADTCSANCENCGTPVDRNNCITCKPGFYLTGAEGAKTCSPCGATCATCENENACTTCKTGYQGNTCSECADGYEKKGEPATCQKILCDTNCDICATASSCKTCNTGYITTGEEGKKTCVLDCPNLIPNCAECSSKTICDKCNTGYSGAKCDTCASGYQQTSSGSNPLVCTKITCTGKPNCTLCSTTGCIACEDNYGLVGTAGSQTCNRKTTCSSGANNCTTCKDKYDCDKCAEGYDPKGAAGFVVCERILCGDNCSVCATTTSCKTCNAGFTTTGADNKKTCMPDCLATVQQCETCTAADTCSKCKDGYKNPATKCVEIVCADSVKDCTSCTEPNGTKCAVCSKKGAKPNKDGVCQSSGLSGGAIAGIVIAVIVVVAGVCCGVYFFMKKQQSNRNKAGYNTDENKKNAEAAVAVDFGVE